MRRPNFIQPRLATTAALLLAMSAHAAAEITFDGNFDSDESSVRGTVPTTFGVPNLGDPAVGQWRFDRGTGSAGGVLGDDPGDRQYVLAHHSVNSYTNISENGNIGTSFPNTNPVNVTSGRGVVLTSMFNKPADYSHGNDVVVGFDLGAFGVNNAGGFKATHAVAYNSVGTQLFELMLINGNSNTDRRVYYRAAGQDDVSVNGGSGTFEGTLLINTILDANFSNTSDALNSTGPSSMLGVTATLNTNQVTFAFNSGTAQASEPFTFALPGGARDIARIDWSMSWNATSADNQNKGYWLDNVLVQRDVPVNEVAFITPADTANGDLGTGMSFVATNVSNGSLDQGPGWYEFGNTFGETPATFGATAFVAPLGSTTLSLQNNGGLYYVTDSDISDYSEITLAFQALHRSGIGASFDMNFAIGVVDEDGTFTALTTTTDFTPSALDDMVNAVLHYVVQGGDSGLLAIMLEQPDTAVGTDRAYIDAVSLTALLNPTVVPEPASLALWSTLGLGLLGFGYSRRRKK